MILWAQVLESPKSVQQCVLVEGISEEQWQVARTLATMKNGKVPNRIKNVNPYPVLVPQRRPLASVYQVDPTEVHGEKEMIIRAADHGTVDVQTVQPTTEAEPPRVGRTDSI